MKTQAGQVFWSTLWQQGSLDDLKCQSDIISSELWKQNSEHGKTSCGYCGSGKRERVVNLTTLAVEEVEVIPYPNVTGCLNCH